MKINTFWDELTDLSAKKEALAPATVLRSGGVRVTT